MTKPSKQFEKDVWAFANTLSPSAEVLFDHKVLDKDTGSQRQVDVWINAMFGNHIPISILISCKNHKRKLDITHIESFHAEVRSTAASTGIIYSSSGFTAPALKKANSCGLTCCRLFRNEPADIPKSLVLWSYCCKACVSISLTEYDSKALERNGIFYWKDLFEMRVDNSTNLLDYITTRYHQYEKQIITEKSRKGLFPEDFFIKITFWPDDKPDLKSKIIVFGRWKKYKGKVEAHLLKGSYCFSSNKFLGNMYTPPIDTKDPPGPLYEEIKGEIDTASAFSSVMIFSAGDFKNALIEHFGQVKLKLGN